MQRRAGHFMPVALLKSQFEALERPQADEQDIVRIDINHDIANVTEQCRQAVLAIRQNRICAERGQRLRSALRMIFKICFQHHAVARFTIAHMLDGVVNFRHREQFGSRRNLAAGGKAHQLTQLIRCTGC